MATYFRPHWARSDISRGRSDNNLRGTPWNWAHGRMDSSYGAGVTNAPATTVASNTTGIETTWNGYGSEWLSDPFDGDYTIMGTIYFGIWAQESSMSANSTPRVVLQRVDSQGAIQETVVNSSYGTEVGTSSTFCNWSASPSYVTFHKGDRLRMIVAASNAGTMGGGYTFNFNFDGATPSQDGDSYVTLNENIGFLTSAPAGTVIYPTNAASDVATAAVDREAWTSRGGGVQEDVVNTGAAWSGPIQLTDTAGGTVVDWWTRPLVAFTLGGLVHVNVRSKIGTTGYNAGVRCEIAVCDADGSNPVVWAAANTAAASTASEAARTIVLSGDDVSVTDEQRLRIRFSIDDQSDAYVALSYQMQSGSSVTLYYAGAAGATGDTYLTFSQTLTELVANSPILSLIDASSAIYAPRVWDGVLFVAAQGSNNGSGATTLTATVPTGVAADDVMVMGVTVLGGTAATVDAAQAWTPRTSNTTGDLRGVAYGNGVYVAVGTANNTIVTSSDGVTWTPRTSPFTAEIRDVAFGNGLFVAVGGPSLATSGGEIATSTNGVDWTLRTSPFSSAFGYQIEAVEYGGARWACVAGDNSGAGGRIATSSDGLAWTERTSPLTNRGQSIAYGNGVWVAGALGQVATATDPTGTWTLNSGTGISANFTSVAYGEDGYWMMTGNAATVAYAANPAGAWTAITDPLPASSDHWVILYANGRWWLSGFNGVSPGLMIISAPSPTGTWTSPSALGTSPLYDVIFDGRGAWVGAGYGGSIQSRADWVSLGSAVSSGTTLAQRAYWRVASASEPSNYALTLDSSRKASAVILAFRDASLVAPPSDARAGQANASSTSVPAPAIGPWATANGVDVGLFGTAVQAGVSPPANYTEPSNSESSSTTGTTTEGSYRALSGVLSVGSITATSASAAVSVGHHVFVFSATTPYRSPGVMPPLIDAGSAIYAPTVSGDGNPMLIAGQASNNGAGGTSITVTRPSAAANGDTLLMAVTARGGTGATITPPLNPWAAIRDGVGTYWGMDYNGTDLWVAASAGASGPYYISTSPDGVNWQEQASPLDSGCQDVVWVGGSVNLWVVVGYDVAAGKNVATSPDGVNWTKRTSNISSRAYSVCTDGTTIAVATATAVSTSTDGVIWAAGDGSYSAAMGAGYTNRIRYGNGYWVAVGLAGTAGVLATATNPASTWTGRTNPWSTAGYYAINDLVWSATHSLWVVVGAGGSAPGVVTYADPTGAATVRTNPWGTTSIYAVEHDGSGKYYMANAGGGLATSTNGTSWSIVSSPFTSVIHTIKFRQEKWVAIAVAKFGVSSGWTLLDRKDSTTVLAQAVYWKIAAGEPSSYAVALSPTCLASAAVAVVRNGLTEAPPAARVGGQANASGTTVTAPALGSWDSARGVDVAFFGTAYTSSFTPPTDYEEPPGSDSASTGGSTATTTELAARSLVSVTTVGAISATAANAAVNVGHHVFVLKSTAPTVALDLLDSAAATYAPTLVLTTQIMSVGLIDSAAATYAPTLVLMTQATSFGLIDGGSAIYAPTVARATTTLYFRAGNADVGDQWASGDLWTTLRSESLWPYMAGGLSANAGSSGASVNANPLAAGPTPGVEFHDVFTAPALWVSAPVRADVTVSGEILFNLWGDENSNSANAAMNCLVLKLDVTDGSITQILKTARATELPSSGPAAQSWSETPPSGVTLHKGDRLILVPFADDASSSMGTPYSATFYYGAASSTGLSYVTLTESILFAEAPTGTTVYLTSASAGIDPGSATELEAWTSRGSGGAQAAITSTVAGPTAGVQVTATAGGSALEWYTRPLQPVTLAGVALVNVRGVESGADANVGLRCELAVVDADGTGASVWASSLAAAEAPTSEGATQFYLSGRDLAVAAGKRLRVRVFLDDRSVTTASRSAAPMASGYTATAYYNGASAGASGDSYLTLPVTLAELVAVDLPLIESTSALYDPTVARVEAQGIADLGLLDGAAALYAPVVLVPWLLLELNLVGSDALADTGYATGAVWYG